MDWLFWHIFCAVNGQCFLIFIWILQPSYLQNVQLIGCFYSGENEIIVVFFNIHANR